MILDDKNINKKKSKYSKLTFISFLITYTVIKITNYLCFKIISDPIIAPSR